ncbi:MAG TPA: GPW/gp25 family protein [Solirubrobacterales bacterium]|nr:GPW/gp25 family protein [Solirubrobacterales bacterium]
MSVRVPHLAVPFQITGKSAAVVEQDSDREIRDSVFALLSTRVGSRLEQPEYGIPDELFELLTPGMGAEAILAAIEEWEPRARVLADVEIEELVKNVQIRLEMRE